jgi:hypothetical protein
MSFDKTLGRRPQKTHGSENAGPCARQACRTTRSPRADDPGEACALVDRPGRLSPATGRGGIGFDDQAGVRLLASESATGASRSHRVALCLQADACAMSGRTSLTELGPDGMP